MEDVHRAGGIIAILGELDRAGLMDTEPAAPCMRRTLADAIAAGTSPAPTSERGAPPLRAAPGGVPDAGRLHPGHASSDLDTDRETGCIRSARHAFSSDGGLAVLYGNLRPKAAS